MRTYDALFLVSFGGPEGPDDVLPFLENVTRGRGIPRERLAEVGQHYLLFGGRSPINEQNRALRAALAGDFAANDVELPVYWGNRNWDPYLTDALAQMRDDGVRRALCLVTSAYASYSGCRQYRENLADALAEVGEGAPRLDKLRHYFNHPGFVGPMADATLAGLATVPEGSALVFVTHSIPLAMAETAGPDGGAYVEQHRSVADEITARVAAATGTEPPAALVYCSRSGPPTQPWLAPDVNDHLEELAAAGVPGAVVVPIGFVSDHMEVVYDLDTEARATAERLGLPFVRVPTVGTAPRFVAAVRQLVLERDAVEAGDEQVPRPYVGDLAPSHDVCPARCCPNLRGDRPAVCQQEPTTAR